jgi:ribosomal protein L29
MVQKSLGYTRSVCQTPRHIHVRIIYVVVSGNVALILWLLSHESDQVSMALRSGLDRRTTTRFCNRECLATDPRDRVIAMKSLVKSGQSQLDHLVDYTRSVEHCFIQVAKFLLPVLRLRMLTAIRHSHNKDMPSWIPDWSQNLPLHHWEPYEWSDRKYKDSFRTDTEQSYEIRTVSDRGVKDWLELRTIGYRYARVVESSQGFSFNSKDEAETQMRKLYHSLANLRGMFALGEVKDDRRMLKHLGQNIAKGT